MSTSENIRRQVMAQIVETMVQAIAGGHDPMEAAEAAYPGTPLEVLCLAEIETNDQRVEAWWRQVEHTIDVAIIQNAIIEAAPEVIPAGAREAHLDEAFAALIAADDSFGRGA